MAEMGIRPGKEHYQLKWKHVEFTTDKDSGVEIAYVTIHENTKSGSRPVLVAAHGTNILKELKEWTDYSGDDDFVFANPVNGKALLRFDSGFNKLMEFANITHASNGRKYAPYSLRHTYATNMRREHIPDNIIAMNMGHEDVKMVQQVYGQEGIGSHANVIIKGDKKRNPDAYKSLAKDFLIKTVIDATVNSTLQLEEPNSDEPKLVIDKGRIKEN